MTLERSARNRRNGGSLLHRLRSRILPEMPDFHGLLIEQCEVTARGTSTLARYMREGTSTLGMAVRDLELQGDQLKARNLEILHKSFSTPMDREDFYRAVESIDEILNYAKTTVREMEVLELAPNEPMSGMAELIDAGTQALLQAFRQLKGDPVSANSQASVARKSERRVEKAYRQALAELFDSQLKLAGLTSDVSSRDAEGPAVDRRIEQVLESVARVFKRREVYRHLSNAADHVSHVGQVIGDIVSKAT